MSIRINHAMAKVVGEELISMANNALIDEIELHAVADSEVRLYPVSKRRVMITAEGGSVGTPGAHPMTDDLYILRHPVVPTLYVRAIENSGQRVTWVIGEPDALKVTEEAVAKMQAIVKATTKNEPVEELV